MTYLEHREKFTVKLCEGCVYTPDDIGELYDPLSEFWCCGQCPAQKMYKPEGVQYPRERDPDRLRWLSAQYQT